jgi:tRNA 2-thiouridine synthesizing protein A
MATDPGSVRDFGAFARQTGNALLAHEENAEASPKEFTFFLARK